MTRPEEYLEQLEPDSAALQRLMQAGATPTNVKSIAGELLNSTMNADPQAATAKLPAMMTWLGTSTPKPSIIAMNGSYKGRQ